MNMYLPASKLDPVLALTLECTNRAEGISFSPALEWERTNFIQKLHHEMHIQKSIEHSFHRICVVHPCFTNLRQNNQELSCVQHTENRICQQNLDNYLFSPISDAQRTWYYSPHVYWRCRAVFFRTVQT